ncbi:hypothetical protein CRM22_000802 [Opisthorchis felineus]|uniref:Uncharacterized protein n=1 Tax=Opisthorchis felineus TaxID=147828 RepID=A0A4S2MJN3_OPIFE|nr:hypothetical protein CRM22_000802 [Opisthorchis felineus]
MQRFFRFVLPNEFRSLTNDRTNILKPAVIGCIRMYPGDELGRGAGKGGGGGGPIRDAGGPFGKREAKHEEEYFHRKEDHCTIIRRLPSRLNWQLSEIWH